VPSWRRVHEELASEALADKPPENVREDDHDRIDFAFANPRLSCWKIHNRGAE
jgi:hypothetical protein